MQTSTIWYGADKQISSRSQVVVFLILVSVVSLGASPFLLCLHLFIFWFYERLACHMLGEI